MCRNILSGWIVGWRLTNIERIPNRFWRRITRVGANQEEFLLLLWITKKRPCTAHEYTRNVVSHTLIWYAAFFGRIIRWYGRKSSPSTEEPLSFLPRLASKQFTRAYERAASGTPCEACFEAGLPHHETLSQWTWQLQLCAK